MPKKYFYDYVKEDTVNGKIKEDTVWHRVKNLKLINQFGDSVELNDLRGKILMVNFFFTHCPTICPKITSNLIKVQKAIGKDSSLKMISITLDPKRDTTRRLRQYADQYGVRADNWWICRLANDTLEKVMMNEFKAGFQRDSANIDITHTPDVFLLDKNRVVRGKYSPTVLVEGQSTSRFYSGLEEKDLLLLMNDAELLKMEKTERSKPPFFLLIMSIVVTGVILIWVFYMSRKKKKLFKK
jgi:protein SCO1